MASEAELLELVLSPNETLASEYKGWLDLTTKDDCAKLAKAAIALANHGGGQIVVGMMGPSGQPLQSCTRPENVRRYDPDAINAAINRYAEPKVHCDVQFVVHPNSGVEHAVIHVPGTSTVPVMCVRDCVGVIAKHRCYIRKAGPMSEEPFTAEEWRGLINRCIQAGRDTLLDSIRNVLAGQAGSTPQPAEADRLVEFATDCEQRWNHLVEDLPADDVSRMPGGRYEFAFQLENAPPIDGLSTLKRHLEAAGQVKLTGWTPFVDIGRPPIGPHVADGAIQAWLGHPSDTYRHGRHVDFWRANTSGQLFSVRPFDEDYHSKIKKGSAFDPSLAIWRLAETLLFVSRFANFVTENANVLMAITYNGLAGRALQDVSGRRYFSSGRVCQTDTLRVRWQATASEIDENLSEIVHSILKPVTECFDFFELPKLMVTQEIARLRSGRF